MGLLLIGLLSPATKLQASSLPTLVQHPAPQSQPETVQQQLEFANQQYVRGQLTQALATLQQTLAMAQALNDRQAMARTLTALGLIHHSLSQYPQALEVLQSAVQLAQTIHDLQGKGRALNELGVVQRKLAQYPEAIKLHEQALQMSQQVGDRLNVGRALNELGAVYSELGQYAKSLELQQQALPIVRQMGDRLGEGRVLNSLGVIYGYQGDYPKAEAFYQQSLQIRRELGDRLGEARTLNNLGVVFDSVGKYSQALKYYQQALTIRQEIGDRAGMSLSLGNMGLTYANQGEYPQALKYYQQALTIAQQIGDRASAAYWLSSMGSAYSYLDNYVQALDYYQRALAIQKAIDAKAAIGHTLNSLGATYDSLGQYPKALEFYQQALEIYQAIGEQAGIGKTLSNIGGIYDSLQQYTAALTAYQEALTIRQTIGDRAGAGATLSHLGAVYSKLRQYPQALELYQRSLAIHQAIGDQAQQGVVLNNIGAMHERQQNYAQALEYYQRALGILQVIGDRAGEQLTLSNIAAILAEQGQSELAIAFYKRSVNVTESIRRELHQISPAEQETYLQTVAATYRALADLLLIEGRLLEAQQVLELLKVHEIQQYTREATQTASAAGVALNPNEAKILGQHGSLIALGQQLDRCKRDQCSQLSQLNDQLQSLTQRYNQLIQTYEREIRQRRAQDDAFLDPTKVAKLREIVEAQPYTVLIYPLVLKDKVWLVWAAKGGVVNSVQLPIQERQLGEAVLQFRQLVQDPTESLQQTHASGKVLYDWLIQPLEAELKANKIQHLVFALDRVTRYIPLGALFDGNQYLIENYTISTVLSADLTNLRDRLPPPQSTSVLAVGASEFKELSPLPSVPTELDAIVRQTPNDQAGIYPGLELLNQAFNFRSLRDNLVGHRILHIATHGAFIPGRPEDSYLVLGNNEKLTISAVKTLPDLSNVHLVVLSACETALGGADQDGTEISGISYYFLNSGAAAVLASLWAVNDASTSQLMQQFYAYLATGTTQTPVTKAEALRQAQLSLLQGRNPRSRLTNRLTVGQPPIATTPPQFAHPYYWAPFVLIGNGL